MKPSHAKRRFQATREFTDREDARETFQNAIVDLQGAGNYRVLHWYGVGGQGKSALAREFVRICAEESPLTDKPIAVALVNFDDMRMRHKAEALLSIRLQLAQTIGHCFTAFDTAFARYFAQTNPGIDIRKRHPELFRGENDFLNDILDWSESPAGELMGTFAKDAVGMVLPGLNSLYKYGSRLAHKTREWLDRRGKHVLAGIDQFNADQVTERLATYLGADICDYVVGKNEARLVVILDTYEALWRDHNVKDAFEANRVDAWIRQLVQDSPGVLFAVMGRDKLVWDRLDDDWTGLIDAHRLGALSDEDSDRFLRHVPVIEDDVRTVMVERASGLPFYLDLQVSLYEKLKDSGEPVSQAGFMGSFPEVLTRFLDHLGQHERSLLRIASYPEILNEREMNQLVERFMGGAGHLNWSTLLQFSFIEPLMDGGATMHQLMRTELQGREKAERPQFFADAHRILFDHHKAASEVINGQHCTSEHETHFQAAILHGSAAGIDTWDYLNHYFTILERFDRATFKEAICGVILDLLMSGAMPSDLERIMAIRLSEAALIGRRGDTAVAIVRLDYMIDEMSEDPAFRYDDNLLLLARHTRAAMMSGCGFFKDAEHEFQEIWDIQCGIDFKGIDKITTLQTQFGLARQIANQGRYNDALIMFNDICSRLLNTVGEEHELTLAAHSAIAQMYGNQGWYGQAEQYLRDTLKVQRRLESVGEHHPATKATRFSLAEQMSNRGLHFAAEREFTELLAQYRQSADVNENHPDILNIRAALARQAANTGRYDEALRMFAAIYEDQIGLAIFGPKSPYLLMIQFDIAKLRLAKGEYREAQRSLTEVVEAMALAEGLGMGHPVTLAVRRVLAMADHRLGRSAEALDEIDIVCGLLEHQLSDLHPMANLAKRDRAIICADVDDNARIEAELQYAFDGLKHPQILDWWHPELLITRRELAWQIAKRGDLSGAEAELRDTLAIQRNPDVLIVNHPQTVRTEFVLARVCDMKGEPDEAEHLLADMDDRFMRTVRVQHHFVTDLRAYVLERQEPQ